VHFFKAALGLAALLLGIQFGRDLAHRTVGATSTATPTTGS